MFSHIKCIHIYTHTHTHTHTHIHTYIYSFWWKKYSIAWIYHILFTHSLNDTNLSFLLGGINLIMLLQISCTYPYEHMFTILGYRMVSTFKLLCLMLLWTFMYIFFLCVDICFQFSWVHTKLWNCCEKLMNSLLTSTLNISTAAAPFCISLVMNEDSNLIACS